MFKHKKIKYLLSLSVFLISFNSIALSENAQNRILTNAFKSFKLGEFNNTISLLNQHRFNKNLNHSKLYLLGLSHSRLQEHNKASDYFKQVLRNKSKKDIPKDIYYELGQSYYAQNELKNASMAFKKSFLTKFKVPTSLYYLGHISQIFEEHKKAKAYYERVLRVKNAPKSIKQVSRFQLAESLVYLARKKSGARRIVKKYIIPQLDIAFKTDPNSEPARDIKKRKLELMKEFGLDPNTMINGNRISSKRYALKLSQKVSYDNNITLSSDLPLTQATQKDSFIFDTEFFTKYSFVINQRYLIAPEFKYLKTRHSDQDNPEVFQNDSYNLSPAVKTKFEHKLFNKPATTLFNINYTLTRRDYLQNQEHLTYARSVIYTLGEKVKYFDIGATTFKIKKKFYRGYLDTLHNDTTTISLDQLIFLPGGKIFIATLNLDSIDNFNDEANSTSSLLLRGDFIWSNFLPKYNLMLALSYNRVSPDTVTSTLDVETSIKTSAKLTKQITPNLKQTIGWSYTNQTAEVETSEYTKNVTHYELVYEF